MDIDWIGAETESRARQLCGEAMLCCRDIDSTRNTVSCASRHHSRLEFAGDV